MNLYIVASVGDTNPLKTTVSFVGGSDSWPNLDFWVKKTLNLASRDFCPQLQICFAESYRKKLNENEIQIFSIQKVLYI